MKCLLPILFTLSLGAVPLVAQGQHDFLSENEVEKVREAQEPNERLKLYVLFARQRMDQLQQQLAKDKKGRSLEMRTLLDEYEKIIESIDQVSNDALKHKADLQLGINAVTEAETKFIGQLQKMRDAAPRDLDMYSIELTEAIATTKDSLELAGESVGSRTEKVTADAEQEKKEVESISAMERKAAGGTSEAEKSREAGDAAVTRRKPPTLLRDGEKPDDPSRPATPPKRPPL